MSDNPLLDHSGLPRFNSIRPEHVEPAIDAVLEQNRAAIRELLARNEPFDWHNLAAPMENIGEKLARTWSPVGHLNAVMNNDRLRQAYNACIPKISAYTAEVGQNEQLFQAYKQMAESDAYGEFDLPRKRIIDNTLRDFRLSGIDLDSNDKQRYREIIQELATLHSRFDENLLDATQSWTKHIDDEELLAGLPDSARQLARQAAQDKDMDGWLLTLDMPCYVAVMTYADNATLREEVYQAYVTRASDQGPQAGRWDNTPVMEKILALRHAEARLLGYANYAERSLATKMASTVNQVIDFLDDLARRSLPMARQEFDELCAFARDNGGGDSLEAWDVAYYSDKLRKDRYAFTQEELKPYFPAPRVLDGLFAIVNKLYGIKVTPRHDVEVWHENVTFYEIHDRNNTLRGQFYLDLYARANKRGGAWMDECIIRKRTGRDVQTPVAYLTCNFTPPIGTDSALMTHQEVITLFHEFGHGLHHMLTQIDHPGVSGINGVAWDAVELPSQFMENWCWERDALDMISGHYQSGRPLPEDKFKQLLAARNFQSGMHMVRQLEFALFDFRLHSEYRPGHETRIYELLEDVRQQVAVIEPPTYNRFAHSFSHIFAGGYAAGYYSYKWAEVLSSDAFSLFEERGIFDVETGMKFLATILEQGGSREPMELFVEFRGREPQIDALLRHSGITA